MSDNFFLDIFNKLLKINDDSIMIIFDVDSNIWFKFRDLLKALNYTDIDHTITDMKISILNKMQYKNLKPMGSTTVSLNFQKTLFLLMNRDYMNYCLFQQNH